MATGNGYCHCAGCGHFVADVAFGVLHCHHLHCVDHVDAVLHGALRTPHPHPCCAACLASPASSAMCTALAAAVPLVGWTSLLGGLLSFVLPPPPPPPPPLRSDPPASPPYVVASRHPQSECVHVACVDGRHCQPRSARVNRNAAPVVHRQAFPAPIACWGFLGQFRCGARGTSFQTQSQASSCASHSAHAAVRQPHPATPPP